MSLQLFPIRRVPVVAPALPISLPLIDGLFVASLRGPGAAHLANVGDHLLVEHLAGLVRIVFFLVLDKCEAWKTSLYLHDFPSLPEGILQDLGRNTALHAANPYRSSHLDGQRSGPN